MEPARPLPAASLPIFREGIYLTLSRWSALQIAVENEWGGAHSREVPEQLGSDIFSWFTQSKGSIHSKSIQIGVLRSQVSIFSPMIRDV